MKASKFQPSMLTNEISPSSFSSKLTTTSTTNPPAIDTILLLEKVIQNHEETWIENLNILEHLIVNIIENQLNINNINNTINNDSNTNNKSSNIKNQSNGNNTNINCGKDNHENNKNSIWNCKFVVRRLPTYIASCTNINEYAIILENFDFTLNPPSSTTSTTNIHARNCSTTTNNTISTTSSLSSKSKLNQHLGQVEIYSQNDKDLQGNQDLYSQFIIDGTNTYCSNEIFKQFGTSFVHGFHQELAKCKNDDVSTSNITSKKPPASSSSTQTSSTTEQVQLLGPQLLSNLKQNPYINKIFKLNQSRIPSTSPSKISKCTISLNYLKSIIIINLEETQIILHPALFCSHHSYTRLNKLIIERIPLHHPLILQLAQSLTKGYLLFPTNYDTIWNLSYWPCESHLLMNFHPSSLPSRIFKIFSIFCLQPQSLLEFITTNRRRGNSLLNLNSETSSSESENEYDSEEADDKIQINSLDSFKLSNNAASNNNSSESLSIDFLIHAFLTEIESFPNITDWAPSCYTKRLTHLLTTTLDAIEKSFFPNYYTRTNLLKGLWKGSMENLAEGGEVNRKQKLGNRIQGYIDDNDYDDEFEYEMEIKHDDDNNDDDDEDRFTLGEIDLKHYAELQEDDEAIELQNTKNNNEDTIIEEIEYGLQFEELKISDDAVEEEPKPSTSTQIVVNPFASFETMATGGSTPLPKSKSNDKNVPNLHEKDKEHHGFSKILRKISSLTGGTNKFEKRSELNETELVCPKSKSKSKPTVEDSSGLEGFEHSINQMRRAQTIQAHLPPTSELGSESNPTRSVISTSSFVNEGFEVHYENEAELLSQSKYHQQRKQQQKESIYKIITERLCTNELFYSIVTPSTPPAAENCSNGHGHHHHAEADEDEEELNRESMMIHLESARKILYSQDELITSWAKTIDELLRPKYICPHTFSPRQIQYIGLLINWIIKCTTPTNTIIGASTSSTTTWEISSDVLRMVLYQMRAETNHSLFLNKGKVLGHAKRTEQLVQQKKYGGLKSKSFNEVGTGANNILVNPTNITPKKHSTSMLAKKFSLYSSHSRGSYDICKKHHHHLLDSPESSVISDEFELSTFGMDNPELATTHRLLAWLWQLRNSKIGRLSLRASKYLELLHEQSLINSFFLEQWSSSNIMEALGLKSATAVTEIMSKNEHSLPCNVVLLSAWKKGWNWAEMILSLASWNHEKGIELKAQIPIFGIENGNVVEGYKISSIQMDYLQEEPTKSKDAADNKNNNSSNNTNISTLLKQNNNNGGRSNGNNIDPDGNAITLAFHSEIATPIGWNDFEDPRRPGPFTVLILIFSSASYYNQWEMIGGNIIQVMTRLQKFNSLQQIGTLLSQPHKKTALNEIRKMNKSTSFRTYQFDGNVMTKTFRRLASLRNTNRLFSKSTNYRQQQQHLKEIREQIRRPKCPTCNNNSSSKNIIGYIDEDNNASCSIAGKTIVTFQNSIEIECTKL